MPSSKLLRKRASGIRSMGTDWAICLVRWGLLALVPVLVLLDPAHRLSVGDLAPYLIAVGAFNLVITGLLAVRFFPRFIPPFALLADTLGMIAVLYLAGN